MSVSFVLASFLEGSTYEKMYDSLSHSLRPCWTAILTSRYSKMHSPVQPFKVIFFRSANIPRDWAPLTGRTVSIP